MKFREIGRAAILFLRVGLVVFAIIFYCFVLDPDQPLLVEIVQSGGRDSQITQLPVTINASIHAKAKPAAQFALWDDFIDLISYTKVLPDTVTPDAIFLSLTTINAP